MSFPFGLAGSIGLEAFMSHHVRTLAWPAWPLLRVVLSNHTPAMVILASSSTWLIASSWYYTIGLVAIGTLAISSIWSDLTSS